MEETIHRSRGGGGSAYQTTVRGQAFSKQTPRACSPRVCLASSQRWRRWGCRRDSSADAHQRWPRCPRLQPLRHHVMTHPEPTRVVAPSTPAHGGVTIPGPFTACRWAGHPGLIPKARPWQARSVLVLPRSSKPGSFWLAGYKANLLDRAENRPCSSTDASAWLAGHRSLAGRLTLPRELTRVVHGPGVVSGLAGREV